MKLIPAIDLMGGMVVQAQGGIRHKYRPLCTDFFTNATPIKVIQTLLKFIDTDIIYLADLDAIGKQGNHYDLIVEISRHFPKIEIWLDIGIGKYAEFTSPTMPSSVVAVVGTETLDEDLDRFADKHYVLSLDFKNGALIGHDVLTQIRHWPSRVIALSLDRIGSQQGPDLDRLKQLRSCYEGELYAGGGVRNQDDLKVLSDIGVAGALVADALYRHLPYIAKNFKH